MSRTHNSSDIVLLMKTPLSTQNCVSILNDWKDHRCADIIGMYKSIVEKMDNVEILDDQNRELKFTIGGHMISLMPVPYLVAFQEPSNEHLCELDLFIQRMNILAKRLDKDTMYLAERAFSIMTDRLLLRLNMDVIVQRVSRIVHTWAVKQKHELTDYHLELLVAMETKKLFLRQGYESRINNEGKKPIKLGDVLVAVMDVLSGGKIDIRWKYLDLNRPYGQAMLGDLCRIIDSNIFRFDPFNAAISHEAFAETPEEFKAAAAGLAKAIRDENKEAIEEVFGPIQGRPADAPEKQRAPRQQRQRQSNNSNEGGQRSRPQTTIADHEIKYETKSKRKGNKKKTTQE
eukprot:TRINITY_DN941_c0_g1_i2.p1 TRINITY_DN941_c0_g1~~TRINITY_DN941_c0_g1_i2.p1  ORF type:complete len:345 (-),score=109.66 TRINITY_DN941_c0_g1_i2:57-1091(-)